MTFWIRYPKMPAPDDVPDEWCIAFEKLDGTNISFAWERGRGFGPARTRGGHEVGGRHATLGQAPGAFKRLREPLDRALARMTKAQRAVAFFEFLGRGSFAGVHDPRSTKRLVLIDVAVEGLGMLGPAEFLDLAVLAGGVETPRVVYRGKFSGRLIDDVWNGRFVVDEGVVIKGGRTGATWMAKAKTEAWTRRLEAAYGASWTADDGVERDVAEDAR